MKNVVRFGLRWPTVLAAVALLVSPAARAGLTVTPAAITNDYQGSVVLIVLPENWTVI